MYVSLLPHKRDHVYGVSWSLSTSLSAAAATPNPTWRSAHQDPETWFCGVFLASSFVPWSYRMATLMDRYSMLIRGPRRNITRGEPQRRAPKVAIFAQSFWVAHFRSTQSDVTRARGAAQKPLIIFFTSLFLTRFYLPSFSLAVGRRGGKGKGGCGRSQTRYPR